MAQNYTNESTFVLFTNDKGDNPKRPDYRGKVFLGGEEYKLSGWIAEKKDGSGMKYIRGQVEKAQDIPPPTTTHTSLKSDEDVSF